MAYESPIQFETIVDNMVFKMQEDFEHSVVEACTKYNINVDKDELIRALQYDRDQYNKGYEDGFKAGQEKAIENFKKVDFFEAICTATEKVFGENLDWSSEE